MACASWGASSRPVTPTTTASCSAWYAMCWRQGPDLRDVHLSGDHIEITSSAVVSAVVMGRGTGAKAVHGHSMTRGEVPLDRLNNSPWIRAAVIDAAGKRAWSNPIWLGEHGANPRVAG